MHQQRRVVWSIADEVGVVDGDAKQIKGSKSKEQIKEQIKGANQRGQDSLFLSQKNLAIVDGQVSNGRVIRFERLSL